MDSQTDLCFSLFALIKDKFFLGNDTAKECLTQLSKDKFCLGHDTAKV